MKTLYLSDLDGTLLNSAARLSDNSAEMLNSLIEAGMLFSVATARTAATVLDIFSGVKLNVPLILMNGVVLFDFKNNKNLICHSIEKESADEIIRIYEDHGKSPMLYFQKDNYLQIEYKDLTNAHQMNYVNQRHALNKKKFVYRDKLQVSDSDNMIYIVTLDYPEQIDNIYREITAADKVTCTYYRDNYTDCYFLECMNKKASKASAAEELKKLLGVDRIVAFGDNLNDIPLFEIADEAYAVSGACDELKKIADGVIGSNDDDAVARFLIERLECNNL